MSAAQVAGTAAAPQAAPPTPAAGPPSAAENGLDAVLGDLTEQELESVDGDADEALEALTGDASDAKPAEPPPERAQRLDDEVIFSEEALDTKAGVLKAKGRIRELQKLQHQKYLELKGHERRVRNRDTKLKADIEKFVSNKRSTDLLTKNLVHINAEMQSGDANRMIAALGAWTGQDGLRAAEQFISVLTHGGAPKVEPHIQQLLDQQNAQIEQLRQERAAERLQIQKQHLDSQIGNHEQNIQRQILGSPTLPHLARIMRDDPDRLTKGIVKIIEDTNGSIPAAQLYASMEEEIRAQYEGVSGAPQGDGGGPAPKQPATAQRPPPGQSVGPSRSAPAHAREPSEEESLRALADDPSFLSQFGF